MITIIVQICRNKQLTKISRTRISQTVRFHDEIIKLRCRYAKICISIIYVIPQANTTKDKYTMYINTDKRIILFPLSTLNETQT